MRKKCKVTFTYSQKREAIVDGVDMKNEKELKDILGYGIGSMDDFGELKEAWFSIDKVEEADS